MIDERAVIDPRAKIAADVSIGPYAVIGPDVEIGAGCRIASHVVIQGPTTIGRNNQIFQFASIGEAPQDMKYRGEYTWLKIGDGNIIREFCTFNRGTIQDKGATQIGDRNLFMAYVHIAHDCVVGNDTIFSNNASIAGHVEIADHVILGGFSGVLQNCRMGQYSFASMGSMIAKDVPPFVKVSGYYAKPYGLNVVGLKRRGFTEETILQLRRAYRTVYRQGLTMKEAIAALRVHDAQSDIRSFVDFIEDSKVGIIR